MKLEDTYFQRLFENSADPMQIIEGDVFVDCNQATLDIMGYDSKDEFIGKMPEDISPLVQPDGRLSASGAADQQAALIRDGHLKFKWSHLRKDNSEFHCEISIVMLEMKDIPTFHVTWHPISLHQDSSNELITKLQNELALNNAYVTALYKHGTVSIFDLSGKIVSANGKFCQLSGYSREEIIGQTYDIVSSGYHSAEFFDDLKKTIHAGHTWKGRIKNKRKDGRFYWVRSTIVPCYNSDGDIYQFIEIQTDITDIITAETNLRTSEKRFKTIAENSLTGLMLSSADRQTIEYANHAFETIWEQSTTDLYKDSKIWLKRVHPEDLPRLQKQVKSKRRWEVSQLSNIIKKESSFRLLMDDGSIKWIKSKIIPVFNNNDVHVQSVIMCEDITDLHFHEEKLKHAVEEAQRANAAKSTFLSRMSHELRTPLNAILGFSQLLEMTLNKIEDEKVKSRGLMQVNTMQKSGNHLLSLVDEVLDLARIESGKLALSIEKVDLRDLLEEVIHLSEPLIDKFAKNVTIELSEENLDQFIRADVTRCRQVLLNLISNAIKYNVEDGLISIHVANDKSGMCLISVTDTGKGIPAHLQDKIFKPFERLGEEAGSIEGTGIGLSLTKQIVTALNGEIGFKSEEGKGTTFWITLPNSSQSFVSIEEKILPVAKEVENKRTRLRNFEGKKVLYIEDNPVNIQMLEGYFTHYEKMSFISALDAMSGLTIANYFEPDVILLDINLPDMDGFEALRFLRENSVNKNTPIAALSAQASPEYIAQAKSAGFNQFLKKPMDFEALKDFMNKAFA